jgi:hypothetical protein
MAIDYARILSNGVGAWLQYEQACNHSALFSEKYLAHPIGNILSGQSGERAIAEFVHPVLAPFARGAGRRPAIDFAICDAYPKVAIGVESKWIGNTTPNVESILWDLIRLEILAHQEGARCFFLLGGRRRDLEELFRLAAFHNAATSRTRRPLLRHENNGMHTINIGPIDRARTPYLDDVFGRYPDFEFPSALATRRTAPFPTDQIRSGYQVYVWEVRSVMKRTTFRGGAMKFYFPRPPARSRAPSPQ